MPCNSPALGQTAPSIMPTSVVPAMQYHVQSLSGIQEDGVGRPIYHGARLFVPKCPAISNYLKQLRLSTNRIPKSLPAIKQFAPLAAQTCSRSNSMPSGTPTARQVCCREGTMSTENVVSFKHSRNRARLETLSLCKQNYSQNSATLETVCTSKKICPRNSATLETVFMSKQISSRNRVTPETVCKLKQNYSLNITTPDTFCTCKQNCTLNSAISEVPVISRTNVLRKCTLPNSISTLNQCLQKSELSVDLSNGICSLPKTETPKAFEGMDKPHHLTPLIHFYNKNQCEDNVKTRSKMQSVGFEVATPTEQPVYEEFDPHPYDDMASRKLYMSSSRTQLPKSFRCKRSLKNHSKTKRRKQKRKRKKSLKTSLPTNDMDLNAPFAHQLRSLREKQKELVEILADLSEDFAPLSSQPRRHRRSRRRRRKVIHSVVSCRFKRLHQLSGWQPVAAAPSTCKESVSRCRRIRWCKGRVRKTPRQSRLRIVGRALNLIVLQDALL